MCPVPRLAVAAVVGDALLAGGFGSVRIETAIDADAVTHPKGDGRVLVGAVDVILHTVCAAGHPYLALCTVVVGEGVDSVLDVAHGIGP